jgi:hypothetical protein
MDGKSMPVDGMEEDDVVIAATRRWLEVAVIGLNLCPFARPVYLSDRIRYVVSAAASVGDLAEALAAELRFLAEADPGAVETTLLIHPRVLGDFLDYNDFLDVADDVLARLKLVGRIQIASFHPDYQFTGTAPDDMGNCTNRSPYPMLHLLREASIERAVASYAEPERIYERNIQTLRRLGRAAWEGLGLERSPGARRGT